MNVHSLLGGGRMAEGIPDKENRFLLITTRRRADYGQRKRNQ